MSFLNHYMLLSFLTKVLYNKKVNIIVILSLLFCSLILLVPAGSLNSDTIIENTSEYLAEVAKNHTVNGLYSAMVVEPKDGSEKTIRKAYDEFHFLYGIFREDRATYAGVVNSDKSHHVIFEDIESETNFSFLHVGPSGFNTNYQKKTGRYLQEFYPLELMFDSKHPKIPGTTSFLYLSQSRADELLEKKYLKTGEHTVEDYQSLVGTTITLNIDGNQYLYSIDDIYYEDKYFCRALNEVMGEFFVAGAEYPKDIFKIQGMFFLRDYAYQNKYYINYATKKYSTKEFNYIFLERNLKDGYTIDYRKININPNNSLNVLSVILCTISIIIMFAVLALMLFGEYKFSALNHISVGITLFVPYGIFWMLHLFTKNVFLLSHFTDLFMMWMMVAFIVLYLLLMLIKKQKRIERIL